MTLDGSVSGARLWLVIRPVKLQVHAADKKTLQIKSIKTKQTLLSDLKQCNF